MNSGKLTKWGLMVGLAWPPLVTLAAQEAPAFTTAPTRESHPEDMIRNSKDQPNAAPAQEMESSLAEAPTTAVSDKSTLPAGMHASGPLMEIIRLANSGLDQSVMMAFITNSASGFYLGAEDIIYLNDIGVPGVVVTAMLQHDQAIKVSTPQAGGSAPPATVNATLAPSQVAPQFDPGAAASTVEPPPETDNPDFYAALGPYGTWVDVEGYGRCWQPTVEAGNSGWRPYFDGGHWVYTDCGWYWLSDYSWGWAPFHYGRWFHHQRLGWCWAPDYVWGPSWVSWRYTDDYCGWAPLPPYACYSPGFGFTWYGQPVGFSFGFGLSWSCFSFVSWNHFHDSHLRHYGVGPHEAQGVFAQSHQVTRFAGTRETVINEGIAPERVAAATHKNWSPVALHEVGGGRPSTGRAERFDASGRSLTIYRPTVAPTQQSPPALSSPSRVQPRHGSTLIPSTSTRLVDAPPSRTSPAIVSGPDPTSAPHRPSDTSLSARALPWMGESRSAALKTAAPSFPTPQPLRTPVASVDVPRYSSPPTYTPARPSYAPAPAFTPTPARPAFSATPSVGGSAPSSRPVPEVRSVPSSPSNQGLSRGGR